MKFRNFTELSYRRLTKAQQRRVVFHEAGHVVAALMCGESIYNVQLGRPEDDFLIEDRRGRFVDALGLTETTMDNHGNPYMVRAKLQGMPAARGPLIAAVFNSVFLDGAGYAAEAKLARWSTAARAVAAFGSSDWDSAMDSVMALGIDEATSQKLVLEVWGETSKIIRGPRGWPAVEAVASAIFAGQPADEIGEIGLANLGEVLPAGGLVPFYLPSAFREEWPSLMDKWFNTNITYEAANGGGDSLKRTVSDEHAPIS